MLRLFKRISHRSLFNTIESLEIHGSPNDKAEFEIYKNKVKENITEFDNIVIKKLKYLNRHHENTMKHNVMVAHDVKYISEKIGLPKDEVHDLFIAALLHDIGKIDIIALILDLTKEDEEMIFEMKKKDSPNKFRFVKKKGNLLELITVENFLKYMPMIDKGFNSEKVLLFIKERKIPLNWTLRNYLSHHQQRTKEILTELKVDPKVVEYAAHHHPEYFSEDLMLDWRCYIVSTADKFNALIQSEGVRKYATKKNRIKALDIIIGCLEKEIKVSMFNTKVKKIIQILGKKYVSIELNDFLLPYANSILRVIRSEKRVSNELFRDIETLLVNIETTFEVNDKVKYILDEDIIKRLANIESELKTKIGITVPVREVA